MNTPDDRVAVHDRRLKVKKMKEIVKSMNAKGITLEEFTDFYKDCPSVEDERRAKLDKYRNVQETRRKRLAGLAKARETRNNNGGIK